MSENSQISIQVVENDLKFLRMLLEFSAFCPFLGIFTKNGSCNVSKSELDITENREFLELENPNWPSNSN